MSGRTVIKTDCICSLVYILWFFVPFVIGILFNKSRLILLPMLIIVAFILILTILILPFDKGKCGSEERYTLGFPTVQYVLAVYSVIVGSFYSFVEGKTYGLSFGDLLNRYLFFSICFISIGIIGIWGIRCYRIVLYRMVISPLIIVVSGIIVNHNINDDIFVTVSALLEALSALLFGIILSDKRNIQQLKDRIRFFNRT